MSGDDIYTWQTYGTYLAGRDPEVVGKCAQCGHELTVNDIYWIIPCPLTVDDYVCEGCLEDYVRDEWGAKRIS